MSNKTKRKLNKTFIYIFLLLSCIIFFFPFYFMIVSATNASVDVTQGRMLPGSYLLENLKTVIDNTNVLSALGNSFIVSIIQTVISLILSSMAGYGFEIHQSKGKEILYNILLLSMMIPFAALMVPLFRMFGSFSQYLPAIGIDTLISVMLPYFSTAFLIFFFRQNTKMFSKPLLEAGRIDGLSEIGLFFRIYMPTMKSTYAAAGIVTFMNSWNNYMWPLVTLQSPENFTVPLVISALGSGYTPDFGANMLAIVLTTIPVAIVFFALQKYFVQGMLGSTK